MVKKLARKSTAPPPTKALSRRSKPVPLVDPIPVKVMRRKAVKPPPVVRKVPPPYTGLVKSSGKWQKYMDVALENAPDHPQFPKLDRSVIYSDIAVLYQFDRKTGKVEQITTLTPRGNRIGWTGCGRCHEYLYLCTCQNGMVHSSGVEYCIRSDRYVRDNGHVPISSPLSVADYLAQKPRDGYATAKAFDRYRNTRPAPKTVAPRITTKNGLPLLKRKATVDVADSAAVAAMTGKTVARDEHAVRKLLAKKQPVKALRRKGK